MDEYARRRGLLRALRIRELRDAHLERISGSAQCADAVVDENDAPSLEHGTQSVPGRCELRRWDGGLARNSQVVAGEWKGANVANPSYRAAPRLGIEAGIDRRASP